MLTALLAAAALLASPAAAAPATTPAAPPLKVVTSLTTYGAIAREILGDKGTVTSIAQGDEDPHFVQPKPSACRQAPSSNCARSRTPRCHKTPSSR